MVKNSKQPRSSSFGAGRSFLTTFCIIIATLEQNDDANGLYARGMRPPSRNLSWAGILDSGMHSSRRHVPSSAANRSGDSLGPISMIGPEQTIRPGTAAAASASSQSITLSNTHHCALPNDAQDLTIDVDPMIPFAAGHDVVEKGADPPRPVSAPLPETQTFAGVDSSSGKVVDLPFFTGAAFRSYKRAAMQDAGYTSLAPASIATTPVVVEEDQTVEEEKPTVDQEDSSVITLNPSSEPLHFEANSVQKKCAEETDRFSANHSRSNATIERSAKSGAEYLSTTSDDTDNAVEVLGPEASLLLKLLEQNTAVQAVKQEDVGDHSERNMPMVLHFHRVDPGTLDDTSGSEASCSSCGEEFEFENFEKRLSENVSKGKDQDGTRAGTQFAGSPRCCFCLGGPATGDFRELLRESPNCRCDEITGCKHAACLLEFWMGRPDRAGQCWCHICHDGQEDTQKSAPAREDVFPKELLAQIWSIVKKAVREPLPLKKTKTSSSAAVAGTATATSSSSDEEVSSLNAEETAKVHKLSLQIVAWLEILSLHLCECAGRYSYLLQKWAPPQFGRAKKFEPSFSRLAFLRQKFLNQGFLRNDDAGWNYLLMSGNLEQHGFVAPEVALHLAALEDNAELFLFLSAIATIIEQKSLLPEKTLQWRWLSEKFGPDGKTCFSAAAERPSSLHVLRALLSQSGGDALCCEEALLRGALRSAEATGNVAAVELLRAHTRVSSSDRRGTTAEVADDETEPQLFESVGEDVEEDGDFVYQALGSALASGQAGLADLVSTLEYAVSSVTESVGNGLTAVPERIVRVGCCSKGGCSSDPFRGVLGEVAAKGRGKGQQSFPKESSSSNKGARAEKKHETPGYLLRGRPGLQRVPGKEGQRAAGARERADRCSRGGSLGRDSAEPRGPTGRSGSLYTAIEAVEGQQDAAVDTDSSDDGRMRKAVLRWTLLHEPERDIPKAEEDVEKTSQARGSFFYDNSVEEEGKEERGHQGDTSDFAGGVVADSQSLLSPAFRKTSQEEAEEELSSSRGVFNEAATKTEVVSSAVRGEGDFATSCCSVSSSRAEEAARSLLRGGCPLMRAQEEEQGPQEDAEADAAAVPSYTGGPLQLTPVGASHSTGSSMQEPLLLRRELEVSRTKGPQSDQNLLPRRMDPGKEGRGPPGTVRQGPRLPGHPSERVRLHLGPLSRSSEISHWSSKGPTNEVVGPDERPPNAPSAVREFVSPKTGLNIVRRRNTAGPVLQFMQFDHKMKKKDLRAVHQKDESTVTSEERAKERGSKTGSGSSKKIGTRSTRKKD